MLRLPKKVCENGRNRDGERDRNRAVSESTAETEGDVGNHACGRVHGTARRKDSIGIHYL